MGIYRKQLNRIVIRLLSLFLLVVLAFINVPWWIIVCIAGLLTAFEIVSAELIAVGIFLDLLLVGPDAGFFGLFFTAIFFFLNLSSVIVKRIARSYEERRKF